MTTDTDTDNGEIKIWAIDECEWWIGSGTAESIFEAFLSHTQLRREDALSDGRGLPQPMSEQAMNEHTFFPCESDALNGELPRTFFEQLAIEITKGGTFPRLFAVEEG